ncbi:hypothetical protein Moror_7260 [Moniliophthora roreri MCA 2997]|uniref:Stress-associated endoplasmic reticulum protein n=1 Tax=Moniliophthora roreri (strain MCA 2997) TaxID=1381753 RepID=V2XTM1_MONRO|nr:hypothetical protein Moror_7260 [Moniliophthora roreri MCA 2997]
MSLCSQSWLTHAKQPTEFEMRQRNAKFAKDAKAGKKPTHLSRQEKQAKQSPIGLWALGVVLFVVCGGVLFELARLMFL